MRPIYSLLLVTIPSSIVDANGRTFIQATLAISDAVNSVIDETSDFIWRNNQASSGFQALNIFGSITALTTATNSSTSLIQTSSAMSSVETEAWLSGSIEVLRFRTNEATQALDQIKIEFDKALNLTDYVHTLLDQWQHANDRFLSGVEAKLPREKVERTRDVLEPMVDGLEHTVWLYAQPKGK